MRGQSDRWLNSLQMSAALAPSPRPSPPMGERGKGRAPVRPAGARARRGTVLLLVFLAAGFLGRRPARALDWQSGEGFRCAAVTPATPGKTGFVLLSSPEAGITFTNFLAKERYITNQIYLNGSGVAAGDVDGDGWCDLYFCAIQGRNALYRNLGNWKFEDITAAGVACANMSCTGAAFADIDADGDLDLIVNTVGNGTLVFLNDGHGHFTQQDPNAPLNYFKGAMSLALADIDGDGDLDLYVGNYRTTTIRDMPNTRLRIEEKDGEMIVIAVNNRPVTDADLVGRFTLRRDGKIIENGEADVLYLNDGKGHFTPVSWTGGAFLDEDGQPLKAPPYDWALTVAFRDLNGDGAPDLYVCNDFDSPDRIWINNGKGQFRAVDRLALRNTSIFSMGVDFADLNRDGYDEVFVSDMLSRDHAKRMLELGDVQPTYLPTGAIENRPQYSHNTLFYNRGDGTYAEISQYAGLHASDWTWSPNFLDVDLDGYEDLLITGGHELQMMNADIINRAEVMKTQRQMSGYELQKLRTMFPRYALPNAAFHNRGDLTFEDVSARWGFNNPNIGNGVALADLDKDGDLDVIINNLNGPAELYRNETAAPRLAVRLKGLPPNTQGIGAKIKVLGGPVPSQSQEVICGGHYLSCHDPTRMFAAGALTNRLTIEVTWRNGKRSVVKDALPNHLYEISEAGATASTNQEAGGRGQGAGVRSQQSDTPHSALRTPQFFEDVSRLLNHRHHEDPFDDFARQALLPNKLSQLGPGVSWLDVDGDGWEDLLIGTGKGGQLAYFRNRGDGTFARIIDPPVNKVLGRDQTTILGFGPVLLVGSSNYEDGQTNGGCIRIYDLQRQVSGESILGQPFSVGPLAFADVDGDGELDLFIGGRVMPGRYPEPATSLLMKKEGDRFEVGQRFEKLGLVSGAVFTDLNGDGWPDLVLACEWGPIRIFLNDHAHFVPWNPPLTWPAPSTLNPQPSTLNQLTGWWAGVATGDLDGDGRLDIVASNWGLNSRYRPSPERPIWIHYGDLAQSGALDVIESFINPATGKEVPSRGFKPVLAALPFIQEKIENYEAYGKAALQDIYGERLKGMGVVEANTLASIVFLNRGDHFEAVPLPTEAQWAPAFGVCIGDLDGDGAEDVFLSQNFFAVNPDDWRHDAGRGLWLKGNGRGQLTPVPGQQSGIKVYGEQRGCALADYDGDGRIDLAVSQNGNATMLFHNLGAKPGLRVRLRGPASNPNGIGACLRLKFGERFGPAREVQAGAGYWSHNSVVQVMGTPEPPTHLWVRWPGGKTTTSAIPAGAKEIAVDQAGALVVLK